MNCFRIFNLFAVVGFMGFLVGCGSATETGKLFTFPQQNNSVLFGVSNVTLTTMTNRQGQPIDGLVLTGASLIRNSGELVVSKNRNYVVFHGSLLGNGVRGRYWEQQSEKRIGLGLPIMDTRATEVTAVTVDGNRIVTRSQSFRVAHARISVDTNDFARPFIP